MNMDDRRLIEDFLPIVEISAEASREKSLRHGHISTLHLWWARRPLVACRAAVYASLVPAPSTPNGRGPKSDFLKRLCKYPGDPKVIETARQHIRQAYRERTGRDEPPKVLDCFAGGGAIPLEALRLGCEAYALELNPVAHLIELCTLVYPQKFGKPDETSVGCDKGKWAGLAKEVEHWGKWVLEHVRSEVGDLYPPIPDPKANIYAGKETQTSLLKEDRKFVGAALKGEDLLTPAAYIWTRTVPCKNSNCGVVVPLVRQTWLCKKSGRYIALRVTPDSALKRPRFEVVQSANRSESEAIKHFGFDPGKFSRAGNSVCVFCGTVADSDYVKQQAQAKGMGRQLMAAVCTKSGEEGKVYIAPDDLPNNIIPDDDLILQRINKLCDETGLTALEEPMDTNDPTTVAGRGFGITKWAELFIPRQLLSLLTFTKWVRKVYEEMIHRGYDPYRTKAVATILGFVIDRLADFNSSQCVFNVTGGRGVVHTFGRQALPMVWDFAETDVFNPIGASWPTGLNAVCDGIKACSISSLPAQVIRGNATDLIYPEYFFDAIITDPPYYDNISYAALSDFFYVWLNRSVKHFYPEHFASELTPKKSEAIADSFRHGGREKAKFFYEETMLKALREIQRVLKPEGILMMVYAHKTVAGWSTLVNALRQADFMVTESWPLRTERPGRLMDINSAALASSIFLVARKREIGKGAGNYTTVYAKLEEIVRERVQTLWGEGIPGADLIIACVGAGLKAFTQYEKVELPNGEEVSPERFLSEVAGVVQDTIFEYLFGSKERVSSVDAPTRFYIFWRYAYRRGEIDAGEAIVFSYPLGVELGGQQGLSTGRLALLEKKGNKYRLRDFTERGGDENLGLTARFGITQSPLIDILHRLLWLMNNRTLQIEEFLSQAVPNTEELRLVAQALAGSALQGSGLKITTDAEQSALQKLLSNWRSVVEDDLFRRR